MKKLLLASAVAALSVTAANAAPTVYGKAFLTVDYLDGEETTTNGSVQTSEDVNESGLNSNSSRIGLKGSEALTANTDVVYKLEYGINIDDDNSKYINEDGELKNKDQFYSRDTYLGLKNDQYGTLLAGRLTAIDDTIDFADFLEGNNAADVGPAFNEQRLDNAFAYFSPDYDGVQFMAMYAIDSDTDEGSLDDEDQYGVGAKYNTGPLDLGLTYIGHGDDQHIRLGAGYQFAPELYVGGYYQYADFGWGDNDKIGLGEGDEKENTLVVGGEYTTPTPWAYYAQVNYVDNAAGEDGAEELGIGGGAKYAFTKAATGHLYAGYYDTESNDGNFETDGISVGGGLEYKF